jgi:hypothetical protein
MEKIKKEYKNILAIYTTYKRLKRELGKPERYPLDPQKIEEDLSSAEFLKPIKRLKSFL